VRMAGPAVIALTVLALIAPLIVQNSNAMGCSAPCQLEALSHVPPPDLPGGVRVKLDGGSIFSLNHTFAFANSTVHTIQVLDTFFIGASSGKRYTFKQWTYTGDGSQWDSSPTMTTPPMYADYTTALCNATLNCPFLAEFTVTAPLGCRTTCHLDALTNVQSSDGIVKVRLDGSSVYSLSTTFAFPNGTVHTIQVLNSTFTGATSGARYTWIQWSCTCGVASTTSQTLTTPTMYDNYTVSQRGAFTAQFNKQFQLNLAFTDQQGNSLSPPSSLELVSGSTVVSLTSVSGQWENSLVWTVRNVVWEGALGLELPGQTVDLTAGSISKTIVLKAFPATVKIVDRSKNPVAGVTVTVSFANTTSRAFQTDSQGLIQLGYIPLGSYTAVVTYQGNTICSCSTDASLTNPLVVEVPVGSAPVTVTSVSSIVLLTILGLAVFLVLLAVRVRKPPPPPSIE